MGKTFEKQYALRNDKNQVFDLKAEVTKSGKSGTKGAVITATVQRGQEKAFTYVVDFGGDFVKTKKNFTPEMYLHTAISIVESQIESKRYEDMQLNVHSDSGLTVTSTLGGES